MNWLVCWYVAICVNTECPDYKPDPYTGEMPNAHCAVYHSKTEKTAKTKWFATKIEADDFIDHAPAEIKKRMKLIDASEQPSVLPNWLGAPANFFTPSSSGQIFKSDGILMQFRPVIETTDKQVIPIEK